MIACCPHPRAGEASGWLAARRTGDARPRTTPLASVDGGFLIHPQLAYAASVLTETVDRGALRGELAHVLPAMVPMLARGIVLAQRDMLLHLLSTEPEWTATD